MSGKHAMAEAERPPNPARVLQEGLGKVLQIISMPTDMINMGIANLTNGISKALPSFPAATMGSLVVGLPHAHPHPPSFMVPLPPLGAIAIGCCVTVLIGGLPAARCGDLGLSPTCLGYVPGFEIFTGSSKVFIGGSRAARAIDVTMHCWPPKGWLARGAIAALTKAAMAAMKVVGKAGQVAQVAGIAADGIDAAVAASGEDTPENKAAASANALSAVMGLVDMAAQAASDAAAQALSAALGKDPGIGPPMGAITLGESSVLIGGFPMPSGTQIAMRKLTSAEFAPKKRGQSDDNSTGCKECSR